MHTRRDEHCRQQPSLFDQPTQVIANQPKQTEQAKQLERVKGSIADVILDFFKSKKVGDHFFASDLHAFVGSRASIAPASADRVMRDLRQAGTIGYTVVSRSNSEYQVDSIKRD